MNIAIDISRQMYYGSVAEICERFGLKRNAYYKSRRVKIQNSHAQSKALAFVQEQRKEQSRVGCRKLHKAMQQDVQLIGLKIGRDKLFNLLREEDMLVRRKRSFVKTTDSRHHFRKYVNKIKDLAITKPNQVWVSDITYIRMVRGHCYLALITDAYSRKIVGFDVSDSLELTGCLRAFSMAQKTLPRKYKLIHHSDRGSQYCSYAYVGELKRHKIKISMTEQNHCYENALAERVNGILKDEFYLDQCFVSVEIAAKACKNAIDVYNRKRMHLSLNYRIPEDVHKQSA